MLLPFAVLYRPAFLPWENLRAGWEATNVSRPAIYVVPQRSLRTRLSFREPPQSNMRKWHAFRMLRLPAPGDAPANDRRTGWISSADAAFRSDAVTL